MEKWKKVDFTKIGFPCDSPITYMVSNLGRVRKLKNGKDKFIGRYSLKKSDIKYYGSTVQIKFMVASCFFKDYEHGKYKIEFYNNDARDCSIKNLDIKLFKKNIVHDISKETEELYINYLENENLSKMAYYVITKYNLKFTPFYNYEDIKQELIFYIWCNLYKFDEKRNVFSNFDHFVFLEMYTCIKNLIKNKMRHLDFFVDLTLDSILTNYDSSDKSNLLIDLFC